MPTCSPRGFAFARSLFFVTQFITSQEINIYEMLSSMFSQSPMFFGSSGVFLFREIAKFTSKIYVNLFILRRQVSLHPRDTTLSQ